MTAQVLYVLHFKHSALYAKVFLPYGKDARRSPRVIARGLLVSGCVDGCVDGWMILSSAILNLMYLSASTGQQADRHQS